MVKRLNRGFIEQYQLTLIMLLFILFAISSREVSLFLQHNRQFDLINNARNALNKNTLKIAANYCQYHFISNKHTIFTEVKFLKAMRFDYQLFVFSMFNKDQMFKKGYFAVLCNEGSVVDMKIYLNKE